ncbi:NFX1-type zinc finger-containing protein 1 [Cebidichthys violaceus]|uniref:NFX1-type zinc finger-containing protein 1 n=1 Tax=Cebidichthys violaceus TaxID=271503 RepID=UPI0035CAD1BC
MERPTLITGASGEKGKSSGKKKPGSSQAERQDTGGGDTGMCGKGGGRGGAADPRKGGEKGARTEGKEKTGRGGAAAAAAAAGRGGGGDQGKGSESGARKGGKKKTGGGGEGVRGREAEGAAGRGGGAGAAGRGGGATAGRGRGATAGRGRGAAGRGGRGGGAAAGRGRGGGGGAAGRGTVRGMTESVWRGGHSLDGRGGHWGEKRVGVGDRQERNEGRSNSTGRVGAPQGGWLGYKTLKELSGKDPSVVAITLSAHPALKEVLHETVMRQELIEILCLVLSKAFKSQADRSTLQHLAGIIKDSGFFRTVLPYYLGGMVSEFNPTRRADYPRHMENILTILSQVLSTFPASSAQAGSLILTMLKDSIAKLRALGVDIQPQTEESVENIEALIKHLQERSRERTLRSDKDTYALLPTAGEEMQPDFRTIPIYPTPEELQQEQRPFLRANLTSQRYTNTHLYLDTHFRLLREDFVRPLREGIQQLLRSQKEKGGGDDGSQNHLKTKQFDDIRVYCDTKLVVPRCTSTGIAYVVQFDAKPLKFVRWQNSKRLIYGSLVCLSCDNFENFLFATVSDRDPKTLAQGLVQIAFTEESRYQLARIEKDQSFLMIETTAYFEAYRYVLEGLKEQKEDNLPFQRYIVECSTDVEPPAYLRRRDDYDLSSVAHSDHKHNVQPFHSLVAQAWPMKEKLGLDESQMRAFQLALTKELTIIQGPPGTGKTYVGLKIAQALLTNQDLWRAGRDTAPMLVVCYTNHALDQFLEGIHTFLPEGIVRVGGRSNSEILKRFNLRELTHSPDFKRTLPPHLQRAYNQVYRQLCEEERAIQSQSMKLECCLKGVLQESFLQNVIIDRHWDSLHQRPPTWGDFWTSGEKKSSLIMDWLGLGSTVFLQRATENANGNDDAAAEESWEPDDGDDLIAIAEEADLILAERFIEDSVGPREGKKNENMDEAVRAVGELMLAMNLETDEIQTEQSEEEWEIQRSQKRKLKNRIRAELGKSSAMTEAEEDAVLDVWTLSQPDRWRLYRLWVARYRVELCTIIQQSEEDYQNAVDRLADVKCHQNLCLLKKATVIGMTTTGAAKFRRVLQSVCPRVVIVEEAAEVLEAHTITTLSKACQHLILIGDHQQLRPSATVYDLAKNFNLEMSMFERLVKMELPYVRLDYQHRMRPEIACLLTPHIYAELENHPSVLDYDSIKGLDTNLFFVEHNNLEEQIKDGKSHQNQHEAMFVVSLCRYLILQGYKPEQITILTTYTGQLYCLRNLMPAKEFTGVKVHVVDKYQGEENDIVLLSLVRSNLQGKVGFLNIPNRVCVALSRAKKGLYCIGNSAMLGKVKLWSNIFHTLREKDQIGNALTLCCQNHPDRRVKAARADDFKQAPEGGCTKPCEFRLDCGHVCSRVCHPYDPEHKEYQCLKKCQKSLCDLGHRCPLVCYKECPEECSVMFEKVIPQCGHTQLVPCHQDPQTFTCQVPCKKLLDCGHPCKSWCGEPCTIRQCNVKVPIELKCGHIQQDACFYKTHTQEPECRTPCEEQLKCGHACRGTCGRCSQGRFHSPCFHQCKRLLICSHICSEPCTRDCPPCRRPCENCCVHSKCTKPCGQPCALCIEPCAWQCPHQRCSKLCHEPCDRLPCNRPCAKTLDCGHQCIGLCGDKCPSKCRVCNHDEVTEIFFGTEDEPEAYFIQLEDCEHIFEYTAMDHYMGMDANQQANEGEDEAIKLKECPRCTVPIRKNLRYGSHINRCLAEIEMVKVKMNGCQADIEEHRETLQKQWVDNLLLFEIHCERDYVQINNQLGKKQLTAKDLWILENKMDFLIRVAKLKKIQTEKLSEVQSLTLGDNVEEFVRWLNNRCQKFTDQQVFDLQRELQRITLLTEINARCHQADMRGQSDKIQSEVQAITEVLEKCGQFTEQDQHRVSEAMKELDEKFPPTGLGISDEERKMIVSALKMQPGHWYKCPNGHVYVITECGGATVSRRCTDCEATIGGANHRLAGGNQVASEMDGAQHPAWSETNNLLNFGHRDF